MFMIIKMTVYILVLLFILIFQRKRILTTFAYVTHKVFPGGTALDCFVISILSYLHFNIENSNAYCF
jgi:hypothetical protein